MSATIPSNKQLDDLLKSTGFDCPENLKGKTFHEATSAATSGGDITIVNVQTGTLTTAGTPVRLYTPYDKSLDDKYIVWFKKKQAPINTRDLVEGRTYKYTIQNNNGVTFDITIKKAVSGPNYRLEVEFKDRGNISGGLYCFIVVGMSN